MNFQVVWDVAAYRRLERIWTDVSDVRPYLNAFDEIEAMLSVDAATRGESRAEGRRILLVPPLGVIFCVQTRLGEVHILEVWTISQKS